MDVTNLSNGKSVTVRINDRGPYAKGRVIDVTLAAAKQLGFVQEGHHARSASPAQTPSIDAKISSRIANKTFKIRLAFVPGTEPKIVSNKLKATDIYRISFNS